jgi:replication fork protection complex subunit Tof1/Swi1
MEEALAEEQSLLRDSLTGLVSALGGIDHAHPAHAYVLGDDALGCLKDIKKWIRFYAAAGKLDALRCIADTSLVALDLCCILAAFNQGHHEHDKAHARLALHCRS